jgi:NAD(P)-dependent dehydrogenase (short-subunit alcohol dehydrogenase family)
VSADGEGPRVALVTGAARGIGAAVARRLGEAGYHVLGADVLDAEEEATYRLVRCDVADEGAVAALVQSALDEHGRIDVLVNVAGIVLVKPLEETDWAEYRRTVDVNLGGTFLLCKHCIPAMKSQGGGAIVNMASVSGHVGQVDHALYGATKGAVLALCRALAWELAPWRIRVNSVSPGSVDTPMLRGDIHIEAGRTGQSFDEVKRIREGEQALGRWADPAEIAEAVLFLAGDGASFVTGADLLVDAGWVAR